MTKKPVAFRDMTDDELMRELARRRPETYGAAYREMREEQKAAKRKTAKSRAKKK